MASTDSRGFKPLPGRVKARDGWTVEQSATHGDLVYWGSRYARILLSEGYRSFSPFSGLLDQYFEEFTSRVLIPDMTPRAWSINSRVWAIVPQDYAWALCARYALPIRTDEGKEILAEDIAECLGCSVKSYYHGVSRGRRAYQKILFT